MKEQFAKVTLERAIKEYHLGFITATGLVRLYFEIKLAAGWKQRFKPREIYELLTISKSAFHKAVGTLSHLGFISYEIHGEISVTNTEKGDHQPVSDCGQPSTIVDKESSIVDSQLMIVDSQLMIVDKESSIVDNKPPKSSLSKGLAVRPDSIQIRSDSIQISSEQKPEKKDNKGEETMKEVNLNGQKTGGTEDSKEFVKETEDKTKGRFDDWLKEVKIPELREKGIRSPSAYLKTIDKETGSTVMEKFRQEYEAMTNETDLASKKVHEVVNIPQKFPIGTMVYHHNSGYSGQIISYPHRKRAMIQVKEDKLLFPCDELFTEPDNRPLPTWETLRDALNSQFPQLANKHL